MNTVTFIEMQFTNIHALLHDIAGDISATEWLSRAAPDQNCIGFIVWHIPRTQDHIVQTWIRGVTDVMHRPEWARWRSLLPVGLGTGEPDGAGAVATQFDLAATLKYANAVQYEVMGWLRMQSDDDLDQIPDAISHLAPYPEFQTERYRAEFHGLLHQPIWNALMRPCIGHVHRHLGELQLAKAVLRAHRQENGK